MLYYNYIVCVKSNIVGVSGNNWSSMLEMLGQFFFLIIVFAFILILAYYSTKWISSSKFKTKKNSNIKFIESMSVGYQNTIQLVQVGSEFFLIGVTKDKVTFLTKIEKDSIIFDDNKDEFKMPFEKYLQNYFDKRKKHD